MRIACLVKIVAAGNAVIQHATSNAYDGVSLLVLVPVCAIRSSAEVLICISPARSSSVRAAAVRRGSAVAAREIEIEIQIP